jgi:radical SAM protein with 4Fe4S-binding SPASM domain
MSLQAAQSVIDLLLELGIEHCALVGGEPTLHPDLLPLIRYSSQKGMKVSIVTNGRRFADLRLCEEAIEAGVDRVSISIEGTTPSIHEKITQQSGSYRDTSSALRNFLSLGFHVDAITTICTSNQYNLYAMVDYLIDLGMKDAVFNLCTPSVAGLQSGEVLEPEAIAEILDRLMSYRPNDIRLTVVTPFPPCLVESAGFRERAGTCQMHHGNGVTIDVDGSVLPCTHFSQASLFNIFDEDRTISGREFLRQWELNGGNFRDSLWAYPSEKCIDCDLWFRCYGGCPLFWTEYDLNAIHQKTKSGQQSHGSDD